MAATVGVAFAANLLTLYIFYEALTFITYPLVTHAGTTEAARGGRRYLVYQLGAGIAFLFPAIVLTYLEAGTLDFVRGGSFGPGTGGALPVIIYVFFLLGIAKAALMPMHAWLPAAMVAPVPVSALLHAVAVVNVGVFSLLRVALDVYGLELIDTLGLNVLTLVITSITILVASIHAFRLDNLKGILAYSTIGQLSYMILGMALLSPAGRTGAVLHLVGHSFSKITLFFAVGSLYVGSHRTLASELRGIGRQMPWTTAAFAIGALSIIGLPPTVGFISKYFLFVGAVEARQWAVLVVLSVSTLLASGYYLRILRLALFDSAPFAAAGASSGLTYAPAVGERSALMLVPMLLTAAVSLLLGVAPGLILDLIRMASG
jgi:multicomponent Na+:H+ antiporter subunit D